MRRRSAGAPWRSDGRSIRRSRPPLVAGRAVLEIAEVALGQLLLIVGVDVAHQQLLGRPQRGLDGLALQLRAGAGDLELDLMVGLGLEALGLGLGGGDDAGTLTLRLAAQLPEERVDLLVDVLHLLG